MTDPASITGYHAHVYYDATDKNLAAEVRSEVEARFGDRITMGRWRDEPVGPHPRGSYQIAFEPGLFAEIVPWLAFNRRDLVVFVHPESGDELRDHRDRALWLGAGEKLKLEMFKDGEG